MHCSGLDYSSKEDRLRGRTVRDTSCRRLLSSHIAGHPGKLLGDDNDSNVAVPPSRNCCLDEVVHKAIHVKHTQPGMHSLAHSDNQEG